MMDDVDEKGYTPNSYGITRPNLSSENVVYQGNPGNRYVDNEDEEDDDDEGIANGGDNDGDEDDDDDDDGHGVQRFGKDDYESGDAADDDDDDDMQKHPKKRKLKTLLSNYEVAEKVSEESQIERTDTQCRNRLDTLKKKYKREKMKPGNGSSSSVNKWIYFTQMDELLSSSPQQGGLSCGVDSGEFIFMNTKVYLNQSNGLDEMRDSPADSESAGNGEDESDDTPPQMSKKGTSFKLLADSIYRFSEIYQKMESSKRLQMLELETMRMDFHRDLELQKRKILKRAQAQMQQIRQGNNNDDDDNEVGAGNASG